MKRLGSLGLGGIVALFASVPGCGGQTEARTGDPRRESLDVPGGSYQRTYGSDAAAGDPATVSGFQLDKYLVTVGRFRAFVAATVVGWTPAAGSGKHAHLNGGRGLVDSGSAEFEPGWNDADAVALPATLPEWQASLACEPSFQTWTDDPGPGDTRPINCVDWAQAYAFCIWDGGFLPSEAEWEYAAAGGAQQRPYPWGSADPATGVYAISGCNYPPGSVSCSGADNVAPVGSAPAGAGRWGQLDMAGELAEWTLDWYVPYATPCVDCVALTDFSYKVLRGGSFGTNTDDIFSFARDGDVPGTRNAFDGVRCARAP
ncbi:MAG: formylglycine-generating enzyme family protein [Polyangia bacterium]